MVVTHTAHGAARSQQRAIPPIVIEWLMDYGRCSHRRGAEVYFFDKDTRKRLREKIGSVAYRRMEDLFDAYVVIADSGEVITTGWRYKRFKHH